MRAIVLKEFGGPEVLVEKEVPKPEVQPGFVLVRVHASSVNPVDTKIRRGALAAIAPDAPTILGCDASGVVEAVGKGVTDFRPGDEVFGCVGGVKGCPGCLAEYVLADADLLAPKPKSLTFVQAATLPLVTITAWEGLMDRAQLRSGATVLVHGGAGGVGHVATQIAVAHGARVFATVSNEEKASIVRKFLAEPVFYRDRSVPEYVQEATGGTGFDFIFDTVGGENVGRCFEAAAVSGTVVSISTRTSCDLSPLHQKGLSLHVVFMLIPMLYRRGRKRHGEILRQMAALVDAGKVLPLIDPQSFTFSQAELAHRHLESGQAVGKVVLIGF